MNRWLSIPACCCLVACGIVYVHWYVALADENDGNLRRPAPAVAGGENAHPSSLAGSFAPREARLLSVAEAERMLASIRDAYVRPWRQWESSPHRLYSRAAPRPIPSLSAEIELASDSVGDSDSLLVGVISVRKGTETVAVPCVVDRLNSRVRFFSGGHWLTEEEWVKAAPQPNARG